jgi:hypothetical protein
MWRRGRGFPVSDDLLQAHWSTIYHPDWDADPEQYLHGGLLKWGHSRRLARFDDRLHNFKAYIGIHHSDPSTWGATGPAHVRYFLSLFVSGQTLALHTYDTLAEALRALSTFHSQLVHPARSP